MVEDQAAEHNVHRRVRNWQRPDVPAQQARPDPGAREPLHCPFQQPERQVHATCMNRQRECAGQALGEATRADTTVEQSQRHALHATLVPEDLEQLPVRAAIADRVHEKVPVPCSRVMDLHEPSFI